MSYIDFDLIRVNHNRRNGTNFKTEKEMFAGLYSEQKSAFKIGDILLISHTTVRGRLHHFGIAMIRGRGLGPKIKNAILNIDKDEIKTMTIKEVANKVGCHRDYASQMLNENNVDFLRLKPWANSSG